jgi:transaldolase/glucose-6-phosphate isomerase
MNLKDLQTYGQSIWLDSIRRDLLTGGQLARLVKEDGVRGVTTNPAIFEKAIAGSNLYDASLERHVRTKDAPASFLYEQLAIEDIQQAADVLRVVYDATDKRDGYISMEVSPRFAHDTAGTLDERSIARI